MGESIPPARKMPRILYRVGPSEHLSLGQRWVCRLQSSGSHFRPHRLAALRPRREGKVDSVLREQQRQEARPELLRRGFSAAVLRVLGKQRDHDGRHRQGCDAAAQAGLLNRRKQPMDSQTLGCAGLSASAQATSILLRPPAWVERGDGVTKVEAWVETSAPGAGGRERRRVMRARATAWCTDSENEGPSLRPKSIS